MLYIFLAQIIVHYFVGLLKEYDPSWLMVLGTVSIQMPSSESKTKEWRKKVQK